MLPLLRAEGDDTLMPNMERTPGVRELPTGLRPVRTSLRRAATRSGAALIVALLMVAAWSSLAAAQQCKSACDVPALEGCASCSVICAAGQTALCTPGSSAGAAAGQKKCTSQPACKCVGLPSKDQVNCGIGCNQPLLLGDPCGGCSVICPAGQTAFCKAGAATDLFVAGKTLTCTKLPSCGCG